MEPEIIPRKLNRLEDFILLSKQGEKVSLDVHVRIEKILHQDEQCAGNQKQVDGYLFIADFSFSLNDQDYTVSKVYSLNYRIHDPYELHVDREVANARLKMDYTRLRQGGIKVLEKYFSEERCSH